MFCAWAVINQVAMMSATLYVHRAAAHRTVVFHPAVAWALRFALWLTTGIIPAEWVALHRKHHAFADREGDPHSPVVYGFWPVQLGNVFFYIRGVREPSLVERYARDMVPDRWDRLLFNRVFLGPLLGTLALCAAFGARLGMLIAIVHVVMFVFVQVPTINGLCHHVGYRTFDNTATNIRLVAWLTGGEGLHNNHHGCPRSPKLSVLPGEVDLGWGVLRALERLGLATTSDVRPAGASPERGLQ